MHCTTDTRKKTVELSNVEIQAILIKILKDEVARNKDSLFRFMHLDNKDLLYRVDVYKVDNVSDIIVFNFMRENDSKQLIDMIDTKDKNIDYEEVVALPCGCKVIKSSKQRYETGQYCLTSNVELHDKCMILYYNNIGVKQIWWILGKENDS